MGLEGSVLGPARVTLDGAPGPRSPATGWVRMPRTPLQELSGKQPAWARVLQAQPSGLALTWELRQLLERRRAACDSGQERPAGGVTEDGGVGGPTGVPPGWTGRTQVQARGTLRLEGAAPSPRPRRSESTEKRRAVQLWGPQGCPGRWGAGASPCSHPPAACGQQRPLVAASVPLRPPRGLPS